MAVRYAFQHDDQIERTFSFLSRPTDTANHRQRSMNKYHSLVYNFLHTFSPRLLNDLVFQYSRFRNDIRTFFNGPELIFPSIIDGGDIYIPESTTQDLIQLRNNINLLAGTHTLRLGAEYQRYTPDFDINPFSQGTILLAEDFAQRDRNRDGVINDLDIPILYTIKASPINGTRIGVSSNHYIAAYIQDDWMVRPRFALNLGLRYELSTSLTNTDFFGKLNPIVRPFLSADGRKRDRDNIGPRIGFSWDIGGNGRSSLHGSYGIYYDRILTQVRSAEQFLSGTRTRLLVKEGSVLDANGDFLPDTPTLANPFRGPLISSDALGLFILDNHIENPMVQQFNLGIKLLLRPSITIAIDAVHAYGTRFLLSRPIGTVFDPLSGGETSVINVESSVKNWYDGLLINVERRSDKFSFIASYTFAKALNFSNDDQITFVPLLYPNNLRLEKGTAITDQRHRFTFAGVFNLPRGIQLSPIYRLESSLPFDILLPDGTNRIPYIQRNAGARQFFHGHQLNAFIRGINNAGGIDGVGLLPLVNDNLKLGDSFTSFDLRLTKTFQLKDSLTISSIVEVFNLFNVTNIRGVNNVSFSGFQTTLVRDSQDPNEAAFLKSSSFGRKLNTGGGVFGTGGPRAFQFALRINF